MKKTILVIIMFFFFITGVYADDNLVIENLNITNGIIMPKFNKYNNYYSVTIDNNVQSLDFDIAYDNNEYEIEILNNNDLVQNKLVYIE